MGMQLVHDATDRTDSAATGTVDPRDEATHDAGNAGWEKMLGTVLFLGGLGFNVAGTDITVGIPVGLEKVAVVLGLVILAKMANVGRTTVAAFAGVALVVWGGAWLSAAGDQAANAGTSIVDDVDDVPTRVVIVERDSDGYKVVSTEDGGEVLAIDDIVVWS